MYLEEYIPSKLGITYIRQIRNFVFCVKQVIVFREAAKGQLISKCPYEKSVSSKIPTKMFLDFCPEMFSSFLGASW